jgi:hypothetical protein
MSHAPRPKGASALRLVGISSVVLSSLGLIYLGFFLGGDYSRREHPPFFSQAWYMMAGIKATLLIGALLAGLDFLALRTRRVTAFVVLEALILLTVFVPGMLWLNPVIGSSVAAASGIFGGMFFHVATLFPLWGSALAIWASRRLRLQPVVATGA